MARDIRTAHVLPADYINFGWHKVRFHMGRKGPVMTRVKNNQAMMLIDHMASTMTTVGRIKKATPSASTGLGIGFYLFDGEKVPAVLQIEYLLDEEDWDGYSIGLTEIGKVELDGEDDDGIELLTVYGWEIGETSFTPMPRYSGTKTMAHLRMPDGTALELDKETLTKFSLSYEDKRPTQLTVTKPGGLIMDNEQIVALMERLEAALAKLDKSNSDADQAAALQAAADLKAAQDAKDAADLEAKQAAELAEKQAAERLEIDRMTGTAIEMSAYDKDQVLELKLGYERGETSYDEFKDKLPTLAIHPKPVVAPNDSTDESYDIVRAFSAMAGETEGCGLEIEVSEELKRNGSQGRSGKGVFAMRNSDLNRWRAANKLQLNTNIAAVEPGAAHPIVRAYRKDVPDPLDIEGLLTTIPVIDGKPKLDAYAVPKPKFVAEPNDGTGYQKTGDLAVTAIEPDIHILNTTLYINRGAEKTIEETMREAGMIVTAQFSEVLSAAVITASGTDPNFTGMENYAEVSSAVLTGGDDDARLAAVNAAAIDNALKSSFQYMPSQKIIITSPALETRMEGMARPAAVTAAYDMAAKKWAGSDVHITKNFEKEWQLLVMVPEDVILFVWDDTIYYTRLEVPGVQQWSAEKFVDMKVLHPELHHKFVTA